MRQGYWDSLAYISMSAYPGNKSMATMGSYEINQLVNK